VNAPLAPSEEARAPEFRSNDLLLRGVRVHYEEAGEGDALLLVHGSLCDHRAWRRAAAKLAERYRVIVPDLPGAGASEKPTRYSFTREALAETLCDLLAGVGAHRAHVAGHALGGLLALTLAADHPESVDRIVAVNAVAFRVEYPFRLRVPLVPVIGPVAFKQVFGRQSFHGYFRGDVFARGFAYDRALVDAWFDQFDPPEARECAWQTWQRSVVDVSALGPKLSKVRAPTAVLWGDRDRHFPVYLAQRLAHEIPDARVEAIPGAGHCPPLEQPDATAEAILRHLARAAR